MIGMRTTVYFSQIGVDGTPPFGDIRGGLWKKYRIHAFYILAILGGVIVTLITVRWSDIPRLAELITFALTVTSLVLAVLAIIYAYVSNFSFHETAARLSRAAHDVVTSAQEVRQATSALEHHVESIPTLLTTVGEGVEKTHALLVEYSAKQTIPALPTPKAPFTPEDLAKRFLAVASVNGLFALLGAKLAISKHRQLNLETLAAILGSPGSEYQYGFLVATAAAGLMSYTGRPSELIPTELSPYITEQLNGTLLQRIEQMASGPPHRTRLLQGISEVHTLFDEPSPVAPPENSSV